MNKNRGTSILILSLLVAVILAVTVGITINKVNAAATQNSFSTLEGTVADLADELNREIAKDRTILNVISHMIAAQDSMTGNELMTVLSSFKEDMPLVAHVEILWPDNTLADQDGTVINATGILDFNEEIEKGDYISGRSEGIFDGEGLVVRNAVPVIRDGKPIAILYGVVPLSSLPEAYSTSIYDGNAHVYIVDGDTGEFLLDTWHKSLGNVTELGERKVMSGHSLEDTYDDLKNGRPGNIGFVSKTTGQVLYMQYGPVGVNNWSVLVTVDRASATKASVAISHELYVMAIIIGTVLLAYMLFIAITLYKAYKEVYIKGHEDQTTRMKNRSAYESYIASCRDKTFDTVTCVFMDVNGLHEINNRFGHDAGDQMLRTFGALLKQEFSYSCSYRVGGDEFVVLCSSIEAQDCLSRLQRVISRMEQQDYSISYGLVTRENETGLSRIIKEADEAMLKNKREYYKTHPRRGSDRQED